jgi:hydrogenase nickel incorporation protein HypA/HybF
MHEVGIMQEGIRMAVETAKAKEGSRVTRLCLRVGAMSGVVPDALRFAFDMVSRDTLAEGAVLDIETITAACWCGTCQEEFECVDFLPECPRCHSLSAELRRGRELELASVELT